MTGSDHLLAFLERENILHKKNGNVIQFSLYGIDYFALCSETKFLQISVLLKPKEGLDTLKILALCNDLNAEKFVTKFVYTDRRVWCNIEFIPSADTDAEYYTKVFKLLDYNSDEFRTRMAKA